MATLERRDIAGLDCHVIQPDQPPQKIAIFCHGFGASGDDLVPLGAELVNQHPLILDHYTLVFPAAPISLANQGMPGARAWWPLDMLKLQLARETGQIRNLRKEAPLELPASRKLIVGLIDELLSTTQLSMSDVVLGGFSQGAMLATDVTLHLDEKPGGLIIWSGTLLNEDDWTPLASKISGIPVVQSHGTQDPILPFEAALWLKELLVKNNAKLKFIEFNGQHEIPPKTLQATAELMLSLLS